MTGLDPVVQNLVNFISQVAAAHGELEGATGDVQAREHDFERQAGEASDEVGGLGDDLQDWVDQIENDGDDVTSALDDLSDAAADIADEGLASAATESDQAETAFSDRLQSWQEAIDREQGELASEGFGGMGAILDAVQDGVGVVRDHSSEAFADLDAGLTDFTGTAESGWTDAGAAVAEATTDLHDQATSLETDASDCDLAFDSLLSDATAAAETVADGADTLYEQCGDAADTEGTSLDDGLRQVVEDAASVVGATTQDSLVDVQAAVMDESLRPLGEEYKALENALVDWEAVAAELATLLPDLVKSKSMVARIVELLNALE